MSLYLIRERFDPLDEGTDYDRELEISAMQAEADALSKRIWLYCEQSKFAMSVKSKIIGLKRNG